MSSEYNKRRYYKLLLLALLILCLSAGIAILILKLTSSNNPLPSSIRDQISYKAVVPSSGTGRVSQSGYQYQSNQGTLTFAVVKDSNNITFVEQPAPSSIGSGNQIFFQALNLHPYAQFESKLGPVGLVKFYQSNNLKPTGQSGVLVTNGTLVIAHSNNDLNNDQWKSLFDSLKLVK